MSWGGVPLPGRPEEAVLRLGAPEAAVRRADAGEAGFIGDDGKVRWSPNPTAEVYVEPEDWDSPFQLF